MIVRSIEADEIMEVIREGESIADYPNDKPYPSSLIFKFVANRPIHVVAAYNSSEERCIIVTCYEPDPVIWNADFRSKRH